MATENDKILESITKLIKLTQQNKVQWSAAPFKSDSVLINNSQNIVGAIYKVLYKEQYLRLYKLRFKVNTFNDPLAAAFLGKPSFITKYILEIINEEDVCLWTFPQVPSLVDLYTAVQFQVSGVTTLINKLLSEE
jgi:hypothetical protein